MNVPITATFGKIQVKDFIKIITTLTKTSLPHNFCKMVSGKMINFFQLGNNPSFWNKWNPQDNCVNWIIPSQRASFWDGCLSIFEILNLISVALFISRCFIKVEINIPNQNSISSLVYSRMTSCDFCSILEIQPFKSTAPTKKSEKRKAASSQSPKQESSSSSTSLSTQENLTTSTTPTSTATTTTTTAAPVKKKKTRTTFTGTSLLFEVLILDRPCRNGHIHLKSLSSKNAFIKMQLLTSSILVSLTCYLWLSTKVCQILIYLSVTDQKFFMNVFVDCGIWSSHESY